LNPSWHPIEADTSMFSEYSIQNCQNGAKAAVAQHGHRSMHSQATGIKRLHHWFQSGKIWKIEVTKTFKEESG